MSPTENTVFYSNLLNHQEGLPSFPDGTGRDLVLADGHPASVGQEHKGTQEREAGLKRQPGLGADPTLASMLDDPGQVTSPL